MEIDDSHGSCSTNRLIKACKWKKWKIRKINFFSRYFQEIFSQDIFKRCFLKIFSSDIFQKYRQEALSGNILRKIYRRSVSASSYLFGYFGVFLYAISLHYLLSEEVTGINLNIEQLFDVHFCSNTFCSAWH